MREGGGRQHGKIDQGRINGDSVRKTADQYAHLIKGTTVRDPTTGEVIVNVDAFGNVSVERITTRLIQAWKSKIGTLIRDGHYKPSTVNGSLSQMPELMAIAVAEHDLRKNPTNGVKDFDCPGTARTARRPRTHSTRSRRSGSWRSCSSCTRSTTPSPTSGS